MRRREAYLPKGVLLAVTKAIVWMGSRRHRQRLKKSRTGPMPSSVVMVTSQLSPIMTRYKISPWSSASATDNVTLSVTHSSLLTAMAGTRAICSWQPLKSKTNLPNTSPTPLSTRCAIGLSATTTSSFQRNGTPRSFRSTSAST